MVLVDPDTYESAKKPPQRSTAAGMGGGDFYGDVPTPAPAPVAPPPTVPTAAGMGGGDFYYEAPTPIPVAPPPVVGSAAWLGGGPLTETVPDTYDLAPVAPSPIGPIYTPSVQLGIEDPYAQAEADVYQNVAAPMFTPSSYLPGDTGLTRGMLGDQYDPTSEFIDASRYSNLYGGYDPVVRPQGRGMVDVEGMDIFQPNQPFTINDLTRALQQANERKNAYSAYTTEMDNEVVARQFDPVRNLTPSEAFRRPGDGMFSGVGGQFDRLGSGIAGAPGAIADYAPTLVPTMKEFKGQIFAAALAEGIATGNPTIIMEAIKNADAEAKQSALEQTMRAMSGQASLERLGINTYDLPTFLQYVVDAALAPANVFGVGEIATAAKLGGGKAALRALGYEAGQEIGATTLGITASNLAEDAGYGTTGQVLAGLGGGLLGAGTPAAIRHSPAAFRAGGRAIDAATSAQNSLLDRLKLFPDIGDGDAFYGSLGGPTGRRAVGDFTPEVRTGRFQPMDVNNAPLRPQVLAEYDVDNAGVPIRKRDLVELVDKDGNVVASGRVNVHNSEKPDKWSLENVTWADGTSGNVGRTAIDQHIRSGGTVRRAEAFDPHDPLVKVNDLVAELGYDRRSGVGALAERIDSMERSAAPSSKRGVPLDPVAQKRLTALRQWLGDQVADQRLTGSSYTEGRRLGGKVAATANLLTQEQKALKARSATPFGEGKPTKARARQQASANAAPSSDLTNPAVETLLEGSERPYRVTEVRRDGRVEIKPNRRSSIQDAIDDYARLTNNENPIVPVENMRSARGEIMTPEQATLRDTIAPGDLPAFSRDLPSNTRAAQEIADIERGLSEARSAPIEAAIADAKAANVMPGIIHKMEDSLAAFKEADARVLAEVEALEAAARRVELETQVGQTTGRTNRIDAAMADWDARIEAIRKAREARAAMAADITYRGEVGQASAALDERLGRAQAERAAEQAEELRRSIQAKEEEIARIQRENQAWEERVGQAQKDSGLLLRNSERLHQLRKEAAAENQRLIRLENRARNTALLNASDEGAVQTSMFGGGSGGAGRAAPPSGGTPPSGAIPSGSMPPPKGIDTTPNIILRGGHLAHKSFVDLMGYIATRFTTGVGDISFLLRQGIWGVFHPIEFVEHTKFAFGGLTTGRAAKQYNTLLKTRGAQMLLRYADDIDALPDPNGVGHTADEMFMSALVRYDPTLRPSQRWNSLFIAHMRARMMERAARAVEAGYGVPAPAEAYRRQANFILHITGRGTGNTVKMLQDLTGNIFFIRFQASLVQRVTDIGWAMTQMASGRYSPEAKFIFKESARYVLGMNALLATASFAADQGLIPGLESVNYHDPTRSDWGTFKINGRTFDPWGGSKSWAKFVTSVGMHVAKWETEAVDATIGDFVWDKLTPGYDQLRELWEGKDFQDRPIDRWDPDTYSELARDMAFGGALAEVIEAYRDDGIMAGLFTTPELGGLGTGGRWGGEEAYQREEDAQRLSLAQELGMVPEDEDNPNAVNRLTAAQKRDLDIAWREKYGSRDGAGQAFLDAAVERDKAYDERDQRLGALQASLDALMGVPHDKEDEIALRVKLREDTAKANEMLGLKLGEAADRLEKEFPDRQDGAVARMLSQFYSLSSQYESGGEFNFEGFEKARKDMLTKFGMTPAGVAAIIEIQKREVQKAKERLPYQVELDRDRKTLADFWDRDETVAAVDYFLEHPYERRIAEKWGYSLPSVQHADRLEQWNTDQLALDAKFSSGELPVSEWVTQMRAMREEARDRINEFYGKFPDQDMPAYTVIDRWYNIIDQYTDDSTGQVDWDAVGEAAKQFTDAEKQEIESITAAKRSRWSTPLVEQYYADMATIANTDWDGVTYWDIDDYVYRAWAKSTGFSHMGDTWDEFAANAYAEMRPIIRRYFPDRSEEDINNITENMVGKLRNEWGGLASELKKAFREQRPAVGAALRDWRIAGYGAEEMEENPQRIPVFQP